MLDDKTNSDEMAKAIQAAANAAGKGIDAADRLGRFLHTLCGDGLAELGHAFRDWASFYRYRCLLKLQDKVERIHQFRKMEGRTVPIPPRYLVPLLESASLESDDNLQELWAGLIANATDPSIKQNPNRVHINILRSMDPLDAIVLRYVRDRVPYGEFIEAKALSREVNSDVETLMLSLLNLSQLGCFGYINDTGAVYVTHGSSGDAAPVVQFAGHHFQMTPLAEVLLRACAVSQ